jgi:3-methyladenine DNA glycosylase AlkC
MDDIEKLVQRAGKTRHGFTDIKVMAEEICKSNPAGNSLKIARKLFRSDIHQARMLATFILGMLAARSTSAFESLRTLAGKDQDWRVQEILAQAFDRYCADNGYEKSLPVLKDWLNDPNANLRRAVTEGLRIWTSKPYFKEHPQDAIKLLSQLRSDESEYVRRSVGNALRDISRKHKGLIKAELQTWDLSNKNIEQVYKLADRFI